MEVGWMRWMPIVLSCMLLLVSCTTQEKVVYHQPLGASYRPLVYEVVQVEKEVPKATPPIQEQPKTIPYEKPKEKPAVNKELVELQDCLEKARSYERSFDDVDQDYEDDIDDLSDTEKDMQALVDEAVLVAMQIDQTNDSTTRNRLLDDLGNIEDDIDDASDDVKDDQDTLEERNNNFMERVDELTLIASQCIFSDMVPSSVACTMKLSIAASLEKSADDGLDATDNILDTVKQEIRDHDSLNNAINQRMINATSLALPPLRDMSDAYDDTVSLLDDIKGDIDDADNDLNDLADDIDKAQRDLSRYCR